MIINLKELSINSGKSETHIAKVICLVLMQKAQITGENDTVLLHSKEGERS